MKKRITALLLCLVMALSLIPTSAWAANADAEGTDDGISVQANGTGHRISVKIYKVVLDSSKPLGYQNPELINTITVTCQDSTGHSGDNHFVNLKEFYPTSVGASTTDWSGWEFDAYYTKGNEKDTFYNWTRDRVNATANVTGSEPYPCSKNFYLVYKDSTPTPPTKPTNNEVKTLLGNIVDVYCTVEQENNTNKRYGPYSLEDGTFTVSDVTGNATNGYTCTVTIKDGAEGVDKYTSKPTGHTTDGSKNADMVKTITLTRSANATKWSVSNNGRFKLYAKCEQTPPVDPPAKPTGDDVKTLLGTIVDVYCTVEQENNTNKRYGPYSLEDGTFTVSDVAGDATKGYTCTVTIKDGAEGVDKYTSKPAGHTTDGSKDAEMVKIVTLTRSANATAWSVSNNGRFKLYAKCEQTPPLDPPTKPTGDDVKTLLGAIVDVYCTVEQENNTNKRYGPYSLEDGTFTVSDVAGDATKGYTCTVTIKDGAEGVDKYTSKPAGHTTDGSKDAEMVKIVTLTRSANATAWSVSNNGRFKLYAKCEQTPPLDPPTKPTDAEMQGILGVKVDCVATTQVKPAHSASSRKFIDGTYEVGEPLYDTARNLWYCAVTITKPEAYIPGYDSDLSTITSIMAGKQVKYLHELKVEGAVAAPTAKLIYTAKGWEVDGKGSLDAQFATINVICRPALPTIPELNRLGVDVNVSCTTKDSKHTGKTYDDLKDTDVVTGTITMNSQGQYECVLKLRDDTAKAYVTDYSGTTNADKKTHTLKDNGSITLVWGDNGWELKDQNAKTLIITATCTTGGGTNPGTKPGTNPGAKNPYVKDEGKKVESGKTFDAGIALYVGLGILSLTGSAAAIYKRREEY